MKKQPEYHLQKQICQWLSAEFPDVLFISTGQGKLTAAQAARNKAIQKDGFKCPDLFIITKNKLHAGLFIELKTEPPLRKDGRLKTNTHIQAQADSILQLQFRGYAACFVWSFEQAQEIIRNYLR
jgi:hypothetical protein